MITDWELDYLVKGTIAIAIAIATVITIGWQLLPQPTFKIRDVNIEIKVNRQAQDVNIGIGSDRSIISYPQNIRIQEIWLQVV